MEYRLLVGPTEPHFFDNPSGKPVFGDLPAPGYDTVLDFGCGCGRLARQLIQQHPRPRRYIGIDRHRGMIEWCRGNLAQNAPGFQFEHHDVYHDLLNPKGTPGHLPLPVRDRETTLFIAWSVFTHLLEPDAEFYIRELARVLAPDGVAITTWFLFDKGDFPMMQEFQNALLINSQDPTNAVIFDLAWLLRQLSNAGLVVTRVTAPKIRGFQWTLSIQQQAVSRVPASFPVDNAPRGLARVAAGLRVT